MHDVADPRYPIGPFPGTMEQYVRVANGEQRKGDVKEFARSAIAQCVGELAAAPAALRRAVSGLTAAQLDTAYRPGGWTVRQVVHHVADSHINGYTRFKLALTEDCPTIRPYEEQHWAELPEAREAPVDVSLALLDALHARWSTALRMMAPEDFGRVFFHPGSRERMTLGDALALYAWHGQHHVSHVTRLREQKNWV